MLIIIFAAEVGGFSVGIFVLHIVMAFRRSETLFVFFDICLFGWACLRGLSSLPLG